MEQDKVAIKISDTIVDARQAPAKPFQQRWVVQAADRIWRNRQDAFDRLAISGTWSLATPWEVVCHENSHSLYDQLEYQQNISGPTPNPKTPATITAHLMLFLFTSATIYMNVGYTKS